MLWIDWFQSFWTVTTKLLTKRWLELNFLYFNCGVQNCPSTVNGILEEVLVSSTNLPSQSAVLHIYRGNSVRQSNSNWILSVCPVPQYSNNTSEIFVISRSVDRYNLSWMHKFWFVKTKYVKTCTFWSLKTVSRWYHFWDFVKHTEGY